ncbi:sodium/solute symporter [Aliiglaciecola sp. 3_MG-2023]|uniref:sodium:solute symporter family transporter n=1 Tax=Aliiglaciecola sp. 3_MG-2023 TaxID=3062644 RepID=UPI0026E221DB|nr:sodium/solute symporter [Aliiglaciecola sp. 3_MG-2023]MDO6695315.1 sodium/solute symporter [Aliiglaciecola sp. 3_MG-2023]
MNVEVSLHSLDYFVIAIYVILLMAVGLFVSLRQSKDASLFVGDKSVGFASIGMSIWGTNIGPSFLIASFGAAYGSGMLIANFEWMAWIFMLLLAMVFTPYYLSLNVTTIPQIIKRRFGETMYRLLTAYSLLTVVVVWLGGGLYVGGLLFSQFTGWELWQSVLLLLVIATSFTVVGGLAAVIVTDAFQTVLMIVGMAALTLIGLYEVGGVGELVSKAPPEYWSLIDLESEEVPWTAFILGYPIMAVWFWCTDQTIVQRVFAAKDLPTAQKGVFLAAALKILPPFIFILPGILFYILNPGIENTDGAFISMVSEYMPVGFRGLMIAVLMAALISTLDSGLNSFSTIFTLDFYEPIFKKGKPLSLPETRLVGRIVTVVASVLAFVWAIAMEGVASNLFELLQSLIAFLAPPLTTLFLIGLFWQRVTTTAAIYSFVIGCITCVTVGLLSVNGNTLGLFEAWPHFLTLSFLLFLFTSLLTVVLSLLTQHSSEEELLPSFKEMARKATSKSKKQSKNIWRAWAILALVMVSLYAGFEILASQNDSTPSLKTNGNKQVDIPPLPEVSVYRGSSPTFDGYISQGEYADATKLSGIEHWTSQFSPVKDTSDLNGSVWIKHDGEYLYFAFDVNDNLLYGFDTKRWLPNENDKAHELTRDGFPWFGDGVEVLINAENQWREEDEELNKGNGHSWQMVVSTHKSRLNGIGQGGLLEGEERSIESAWNNYQKWILEKAMEAKVQIKSNNKGYTIEWRIKPNPTLEIAPGEFWHADMPTTRMGLNIAIADLDNKHDGEGNWGNIHHENWWSGDRNKPTWLKNWGTMILHGDFKFKTTVE